MRNQGVEAGTAVVENISKQPYPTPGGSGELQIFSSSSSVGVVSAVTGPRGKNGVRMTRVATGALALYMARSGSAMWRANNGRLVAGETWTIINLVRTSAPNAPINRQIGYGSGASSTGRSSLNTVTPADTSLVEQRQFFTFDQIDVDRENLFLKWNPTGTAGTPGGNVGDWFEIFEICVVKGVYLGPMIAGDLPNSVWVGTPEQSASRGIPRRTDLLYNLAPNPGAEVYALGQEGAGAGTGTRDTTRFLFGSSSTKFVWGSGARGLSLFRDNSGVNFKPVGGLKYVFSFWVFWESGSSPSNWQISDQNYRGLAGSSLSGVPVLGQWTRMTGVIQTAVATTDIRVLGLLSSAATYYVDGVQLYQGDSVPELTYDGNMPGWYWDGTPGNSTSWGSPWRIEDILKNEKVLLDTESSLGSATSSLPWPTPPGLNQPFTMFWVYDQTTHVPSVTGNGFSVGDSVSSDVLPNSAAGIRVNTGTQPTNPTAQLRRTGGAGVVRQVNSIGKHVVWGGLDASGKMFLWTDAFPTVPSADNTVMNLTPTHYTLNAPGGGVTSLRRMVVAGHMAEATMRQVAAWMKNKYGLAA